MRFPIMENLDLIGLQRNDYEAFLNERAQRSFLLFQKPNSLFK
jgi:hypothetical protein